MSWVTVGPPSTETRLNRVYPSQLSDGFGVDFVWRVQTQGPWAVTSGNQVQIKSFITEGVPG